MSNRWGVPKRTDFEERLFEMRFSEPLTAFLPFYLEDQLEYKTENKWEWVGYNYYRREVVVESVEPLLKGALGTFKEGNDRIVRARTWYGLWLMMKIGIGLGHLKDQVKLLLDGNPDKLKVYEKLLESDLVAKEVAEEWFPNRKFFTTKEILSMREVSKKREAEEARLQEVRESEIAEKKVIETADEPKPVPKKTKPIKIQLGTDDADVALVAFKRQLINNRK